MILREIELFSYAAVLMGQRHLLLSLLGLGLILLISRTWRRQSSASILYAWLFFLSWLVWAPLVFTPELLKSVQAPIRNTWSAVGPADIFSLCSQSVLHRLRTPLGGLPPQLTWNSLIIGLWALAAGWRTFHLWRKRRRYVTITQQAESLNDPVSTAMVERWRQAYGVRRPVRLCMSPACQQAFTLGLRRPVIHIPSLFLQELDAAELDAVIGHEMAHVSRWDDLVISLQRLLRGVFFFNPVIAVVNRRVAELREQCCDRLAMERGRLSVRHYGRSLLRTLALKKDREDLPVEVAGLHATALRRRIESLSQGRPRFAWKPLLVTMLALASLSLLFGNTGSDPMNARDSGRVLAGIGAVSPVPEHPIHDKPFVWPDQCRLGPIQPHHYHPGVDFSTPRDQVTPIRTIADGRVIRAFHSPGLDGWHVHIRHSHGVVSSYLHLEDVSVKRGDRLSAGDTIALNSGDRHQYIHVEVHQRGRVLDPGYLTNLNH